MTGTFISPNYTCFPQGPFSQSGRIVATADKKPKLAGVHPSRYLRALTPPQYLVLFASGA